MRQLKLQMQIAADGFVAGPQGQLDWMTSAIDEALIAFINQLTNMSDAILLGRKMTLRTPKVVFSKTVHHMDGQNVRVENDDPIDELNLFVNPVAIGEGLRPFSGRKPLTLAGSTPCGIVVNTSTRK
jgi:hypothetical protein